MTGARFGIPSSAPAGTGAAATAGLGRVNASRTAVAAREPLQRAARITNEYRKRLEAQGHPCHLIFVTPEYNRSVPGGLKNAIDVASRPYGKSAFDGKPAAVVSVSPGAIGGFGANHHLRQSLVFLNMPTLQQPEAYIGGAADLFDSAGKLSNEKTREFMQKFLAAFEALIGRVKG